MTSPARGALVERWLFNIGAVLGALCLVLAGLTLAFGLKPLIFSSGSMGPAIPTGSLALALPAAASNVSPGEVVSVVSSGGTRITHRVVSADPSIGLVLKGDANAVADLLPYAGATVDRVLFSIPGLGYVAGWLGAPWVFLLGGLLSAYLIYVAFFRAGPWHSTSTGDNAGDGGVDNVTNAAATKPGTRRRTWLSVGAIVAVVAVAVPLGVAAKVESTQAAWTASATARTVSTALTLPSVPGALQCVTPFLGLSANLSWDSAALPTGARYVIRVPGTHGIAYVDTGQNRVATLEWGLSLLSSLFQKRQNLSVTVHTVFAKDKLAAESTGANIGWISNQQSGASATVDFNPGLLAQSYKCVT